MTTKKLPDTKEVVCYVNLIGDRHRLYGIDSTEMAQILGDFIDTLSLNEDCLELTFTPSSVPIKQRWRSNRLSAHFVADYFSNFLPIDEDDPDRERRIKEAQGAVSYIANELLENAMKFNYEQSSCKIKFGIHFLNESLSAHTNTVTAVIFVVNCITPEIIEKFTTFIKELLTSDPGELYVRQVERSIEEDPKASGLGLLSMVNDYSAKLGWKLETSASEPPLTTVTTMVQLQV